MEKVHGKEERKKHNSTKNNKSYSKKKAIEDIKIGLMSYSLWGALGWQDIRQRYRRSSIGPFWITLSLGVTVTMMGMLYAKLFHQDIHYYVPYLATGMVVWSLVSGIINEAPSVFISSEGIIKQIPMPFGVHAMRMIWRNTIIFFHNMLVVVVVLLIFGINPGWNIFSFPIALILIMVNGYWVAILLGILGARYRDILQMVANVVQILFFLTPVMWSTASLQSKEWLLNLNPLYHVLAIMRNSLLGGPFPLISWGIVILMAFFLGLLALWLLSLYSPDSDIEV